MKNKTLGFLPANEEPVDITQLSLLLKVLPSGAEVKDSLPPEI